MSRFPRRRQKGAGDPRHFPDPGQLQEAGSRWKLDLKVASSCSWNSGAPSPHGGFPPAPPADRASPRREPAGPSRPSHRPARRVPSPDPGRRPNGRGGAGEPRGAPRSPCSDSALTAGPGRRGPGARGHKDASGGGERRGEGARTADCRDARTALSAPQNQQDFQNGGLGKKAGMRRPIRATGWELAREGGGNGMEEAGRAPSRETRAARQTRRGRERVVPPRVEAMRQRLVPGGAR